MIYKSLFLVKKENYSTIVGSKSNNNGWDLTKSLGTRQLGFWKKSQRNDRYINLE